MLVFGNKNRKLASTKTEDQKTKSNHLDLEVSVSPFSDYNHKGSNSSQFLKMPLLDCFFKANNYT